jgi:hypothetical protein
MSKAVNDVRSTSFDARYAGVTFSGSMRNAIKQARNAPDYGLPDADLRAPAGMSRDRAMLLGFLRLLPQNPLDANPGIPFSVLSAELSGRADNAARTADLRHWLQDKELQFVSAEGSYKGVKENSFVVLTPSVIDRLLVGALAEHYGQESILHVEANRRATLHYFGVCQDVHIGMWQPVASVAGLDAWTLVAGQHYAVKSKHSPYSLEYAQAKGWVK